MKETNPIEQRIESMADKWKDAIELKNVRIIRIQSKADEDQMVDAFIWYMLGLDSLIDDIAFILDPLFTDEQVYSSHLLKSLDACIREWNEIPKEEGIEFVQVKWKPDMELEDKKNPAALFVRNFNRLAESLNLEDGRFTVATLTVPHDPKREKEIRSWMENALKAGISSKVRFLVIDTFEHPVYSQLAGAYPKQVYTIVPDFDMDNVMSQVAAMGDPADPATPYRIAFVNMMNAMSKKDSKKARKEGETCIRIAKENEPRDPNWGIQVVVVYIALVNDELRAKDYEKAIKYTNQAIEAGESLSDQLDPLISSSMVAQAYMTKASVYCYPKEWKKAISEYLVAAEWYTRANNMIMAIEAYRMAGFCAAKSWTNDNATEYLAKGFLLGEQVNPETLKASTYSALIKQLLSKNYSKYITYDEIDRIASSVYGDNWEETIDKIWKESPDVEARYSDAISMTDVPIKS